MLKQLDDQSNDVQSIAVKCLGILFKRVQEAQVRFRPFGWLCVLCVVCVLGGGGGGEWLDAWVDRSSFGV